MSTSSIYLNPLTTSTSKQQQKFKFPNISVKFKLNSLIPVIDIKLCVLCFIWYFTSVISSNSTKSILREFKYPITLTELQFIMNAGFCLLTIAIVKKFNRVFNGNSKYTKKIDYNSLYSEKDGFFTLIEVFPKGTFPINLGSKDYSILRDFLKPSKFILLTTLPMGIFQFVGHIASHKSTSIIPVSLVHTIKALSPLTTVLIYRVFFGVRFKLMTYITLIPLMVGVMLCCTKNNDLSITDDLFFNGCIFAFISMLIFVSQNIFAKRILTVENDNDSNSNDNTNNNNNNNSKSNSFTEKPFDYFSRLNSSLSLNLKVIRNESASTTPILPIAHSPKNMSPPPTPLSPPHGLNPLPAKGNKAKDKKKLDKISVLFYCSIVGFFLTLPVYLINDFISSDVNSLAYLDSCILKLLLINGISHFTQSIVAFTILGLISPINYSIANILKRIIIISFSIVIEGTKLNAPQYFGLSLTFFGLYCYDKWGVQHVKK